MAFSLDKVFTTVTAFPPAKLGVTEIPPTEVLKPFIRCFWQCNGSGLRGVRVIPDCCADIIIPTDGNKSIFVGVSDGSFCTLGTGVAFGIRFYAWALKPFINARISDTFNTALPASEVFKGFSELQNRIAECPDIYSKAACAERYLIEILKGELSADIMNSIYYVVARDGGATVKDVSDYIAVGKRTLERRFVECAGVSPKAMLGLIRYQMLWQSCVKGGFSAPDSAFRLGYYDEAHMYNDFKRYHGIGISEARAEYAALSHFYNTSERSGGIIVKKA
ncbi:MAG: helix-turn-helix domain-containing protein [Clostridiales bacterium]|nr:helix-turn-helix domain-containing protein [Clostridiales bacterium]